MSCRSMHEELAIDYVFTTVVQARTDRSSPTGRGLKLPSETKYWLALKWKGLGREVTRGPGRGVYGLSSRKRHRWRPIVQDLFLWFATTKFIGRFTMSMSRYTLLGALELWGGVVLCMSVAKIIVSFECNRKKLHMNQRLTCIHRENLAAPNNLNVRLIPLNVIIFHVCPRVYTRIRVALIHFLPSCTVSI